MEVLTKIVEGWSPSQQIGFSVFVVCILTMVVVLFPAIPLHYLTIWFRGYPPKDKED